MYLVSAGVSAPCGKLPLPLLICPCCGHGVKYSRGYTWVDATKLFAKQPCKYAAGLNKDIYPQLRDHCYNKCPIQKEEIGRCGLIWIGKKFYKTPDDWLKESQLQGVSRKLKTIPHGFEIGKTWILTAHLEAIKEKVDCTECKEHLYVDSKKCTGCKGKRYVDEYTPAIFQAFLPTEIQYVVKGDETDEEIETLEKRGLTPVKIEKNYGDPSDLFNGKIEDVKIKDASGNEKTFSTN